MNPRPFSSRIIAKGAVSGLSEALQRHMPVKNLLLVGDENTFKAAGDKVVACLSESVTCTHHSLGKYVEPLLSHALALSELAQSHDAILVLGSGTLNDICKYAAQLSRKPYCVVATAASMNGYNSATASLRNEEGHAGSYPAAPPRAVIADLDILVAAPKRMTRAGLGDTLCRSTVEADAILSHYFIGTPYHREWFDRLRTHESDLLTLAGSSREANPELIEKLFVALMDAGDGMAETGSSSVSSQSEHMIGHTARLLYKNEIRNLLHGEMIALTTVTVNHFQHKMLLGTPVAKSIPRDPAQFERVFGKRIGQAMAIRYQNKVLSAEQVGDLNARMPTLWPEIKTVLSGIMISANTIERIFLQSGLAIRPGDVGMTDERYRSACSYAYLTRDRFTFLDLAAMNDKRVV